MAATLFIIQIPKENEKIAIDELEDDGNGIDDPQENERKGVSFEDSDLEVDAQRVVDCNGSLTALSTVSTSKNTDTNELNFNTEDEIGDVPLKQKERPSLTLITTSSTQNVNEEKNTDECPQNNENIEKEEEEEEKNPFAETFEPILNEPKSPEVTMLDFIVKESLETKLKNLLASMSITNVNWTNVEEYQQVMFIDCGDPNRVEDILENLISIGIGQKIVGTSVSLFPATVHIETVDDNKEDGSNLSLQKESESNFLKSVKSRMIVAQVVETVRSNAVFTFDYCILIILASVIACIGLVENSSVILVASMLISPLMGPILAGTFGFTIQNSPLRNLGILSECIGLTMCIVCGFICGLIVGKLPYVEDELPTIEMTSRGMMRSLYVGVLIALPSGAGVALSVLGGNTGSLVGVAISASLLPPAVNAGMLWAFALLTVNNPPATLNNSTIDGNPLDCRFPDNDYVPTYSCNMAKEMGTMGAVSLLLTLINILCIYVVGVLMLKIKEVVPQTSSASTVEFWGSDLKVARDSYKTMKGPESVFLQQKFRSEWEKLKANKREEIAKKEFEYEKILQKLSKSANNPYLTQPAATENHSTPQAMDTKHHTIHSIPYSKLFNYETYVPSPGITLARPFSYPNNKEIHRRKSRRQKKNRFFNIGGENKRKFTVTSVPESSIMEINEENV